MQTPSVKQRSSPLNETTSLSVRLLRSETNASAGAPLMNSPLRVQAWRKVRGLRTTDPSAEIEGGMATLHRTGETRPSSLGQTTEAAQESDQHESALLKEEMKRIQQELMRAKRALENRKAKLRVAREDLLVAKQELNEAQEEIAELTECLEHANKTGGPVS
ncbi:hypothetical protein BKA70DRAFT_1449070 [Coprinopsis sp. MPI-PUGE-AT-0042]|nr:hypothetical protein BKA70DRAFT_1449070 [Coprinopsis sp. MPI-PUGE-AT-0042]